MSKVLETVDQYNARRRAELDEARRPRATGIACPACWHELVEPRTHGSWTLSMGSMSGTGETKKMISCESCRISVEVLA